MQEFDSPISHAGKAGRHRATELVVVGEYDLDTVQGGGWLTLIGGKIPRQTVVRNVQVK